MPNGTPFPTASGKPDAIRRTLQDNCCQNVTPIAVADGGNTGGVLAGDQA